MAKAQKKYDAKKLRKKGITKKGHKEISTIQKFVLPIAIILILMITILLGISVFQQEFSKEKEPILHEEENIKYNTNEKVIEDKNINGILFTNIECSYDGNNSLLKYTIVNHTTETIHLGEYEIMVKDKDGTLLAILAPNLDQEIAPEGSSDTGNAINIDLSTAYSIELKLNEE